MRKAISLFLAVAVLLSLFSLGGITAHAEEREVVSLKEVYKDYFMIGSVMNPRDNAAKYDFLKFHFNALTPENDTKPDSIWNRPTGNPNYRNVDTMVAKVKADSFYTIGHALAWHNQSSNWPSPGLTYEEAKEQLETYISTIAGHFYADEAIRFDAWDVVNEAMRDNPENPTDWRNALRHGDLPIERPAKWYAAYANGGNGWDYVYDAFVFARKYAPNALLNYNDFNDEEVPNKAIAIASMVTELNERYAREHPENPRKLIESIGIQAHYSTRLNLANLEENLKIYAATGCRICLTELDVQYNGTVGRTLTEEEQKIQANFYARLFMLLKKYAAFIDRVTFWGVDDASNWRSSQRPMLFDVNRQPKEAYWAVVDPEGYLGLTREAPRLNSFTYAGETIQTIGYDFDVNVPDETTQITFTADDVSHSYNKEDITLTVALSDDGVVAFRKPCTATVRIAWADAPESFNEYRINFGKMCAEWLPDVNYPDTDYRVAARVRFSDGVTPIRMKLAFGAPEEDPLAPDVIEVFDPLPKNESGIRYISAKKGNDNDAQKHICAVRNDCLDNLAGSEISYRADQPRSYYKLATEIVPGKTYIIVSSETGKAFTHKALQPVPVAEGDGITLSGKAGYEATPVTVENDVIVAPELIQDNIRFILLPRESPDAGAYTDGVNLLSLVHGGLIQPFIIWREDVDTATAGLYSNTTIGDADLDRAVWYNTGLDPETHETIFFLHSASDNLTYVLMGNESGFAAEGGKDIDPETMTRAKVKLYELVSEENPQYHVRLHAADGGSITVSTQLASPGNEILAFGCPDPDYTVSGPMVIKSHGDVIDTVLGDDGKYRFTMPEADVDIYVDFAKKPVENPFTDVSPQNFYYTSVLWAYGAGITKGQTETTFRPELPCTRAQMATFLWRAAGCPKPLSDPVPFNDIKQGAYYYDAVQYAGAAGITKGISNNAFGPDLPCTRGQMVTFLYRFSGSPEVTGTIPFMDVPENAYYYKAVLWAVQNGITDGVSPTSFNPNRACTRGEMATFLYRCLG